MPNRIIKESINESRSLSELSFFAEDLFKRLITYCDDFGRFNADYQIILARLYTRAIQVVSESDIEDALIELSGARQVGFYTSNSEKEIYGCLPNWNKHQRIRESKNKFPDPDDTSINDWYIRRFIPMKLKQEIIERDGFKCRMCGKYITTIQDSRRLIKMGAGLYHIDYIVPVNQGGMVTKENLRLVCPECNLSRKRIFTVEEMLEMALKEIENTENLNKSEEFAASCGEEKEFAASCGYNPIQSESNKKTMCKADADALFEKLWQIYPCKKGKGQISDAKKRKLLEVGFEEMSRAIDRYLEGLKKDEWRKPQNGSTFFNSGYIDYLDTNYGDAKPDISTTLKIQTSGADLEAEELIGDDEEWWKYGPNAWED